MLTTCVPVTTALKVIERGLKMLDQEDDPKVDAITFSVIGGSISFERHSDSLIRITIEG